MALLQWKPNYSLGIEAVDYEHRELIDLINQLHEALTKDGAHITVPAFFGELHKGIASHFALEETFMRGHGYDQLADHKADHERLLDEIRDIMDSWEDATEPVAPEKLAEVLDNWFTRHFATHDARLHKKLGAHPH
jgi:hemerythrin-like metal-binding protein